ncbi:hypothetical protein QVN42_08000 [Yersinia nurmii]|uniref:Uncharacterized protein n=1 Tax=Yersinia nurmii TaxID=685706 RepID=A0AAW7K7C8_9GAMM|nr:hypothetical protein [Yersinia nurmii]MDN0087335.1 hypothetical protein [Yersinia nurmii]
MAVTFTSHPSATPNVILSNNPAEILNASEAAAALQSIGLAILAEFTCRNNIAAGRLVAVKLENPLRR